MAADKSSLEKQLEDYRFALSKVSHEVRNPVTLINSYLQLLEKDHPELKQNELWSDITEEMLFLRRLLDDLSCYNNTFRCQFSATEMSPFLLKLSESVYLLFPDSPISYQISVPENLPTLSVDPLKLNQALTNLLRNSFESAAQSVSFSVVEKQDCLQIDIINDGASISKEQQTEFFKPFVTTKPNGTGLGLPIARGIIEAHHGSIAFLFPEETSDSKNTPDNPDKSGTLLNHMSGSHLRIVLPLS